MFLALFFLFISCEQSKIKEQENYILKKIDRQTKLKKYIENFKTYADSFAIFDIYTLSETLDYSEATQLMEYQRSLSADFKNRLLIDYNADSFEVFRSISLVILKKYYYSAFRNETEDIRGYVENTYRPHIQQLADSTDIDSAAIQMYPLAYFFLRYQRADNPNPKLSTYGISKSDMFLLSHSYQIIKSHPKLKNYPPIKKMLQKLAKKKWGDGEG